MMILSITQLNIMSNDLHQPEFIVEVDNIHVKPIYKNTPVSISSVSTYYDLKVAIEKHLKSPDGLDILYLCQMINDYPELRDNMSNIIYNTIRKYVEINLGSNIKDFWELVAKEGDSSHEIFKKRRFPSSNVRNQKWKIIMSDITVAYKKRMEKLYPDDPKPKMSKDYPKDRKHIIRLSEKEQRETNYDKIKILDMDKYYNEFTKEEITILFKCLHNIKDPGLMLKLWCKLVLQYETVHLVLFNKDIWDLISQHMRKKNVHTLVSYCMFYGLFILSKEELLCPIGISTDYRCLITHDEANNVPELSNDIYAVDINPWNTQMVGSEYVSSCAVFHLDGNRKLTSPKEFRRRLKIITNGSLEGINLAKYNATLVGSALIPCAAYNPLEKFFMKDPNNPTEHEFKKFINYYYPPESEIDKHAIIDSIEESPSISDIDIFIQSASMEEFIQKTHALFDKIKKNKPDAELKEYTSVASWKFTVVLPGERWIDIFTTTENSTADLIWRFHLSIVKMYWDGTTLWMFRSCIASLLTGICDSHGWVSCNKSAAEIILKYSQRGYAACINLLEKEALIKYMESTDRWNIWNSDDKSEVYITGTYSDYHRFFHPGQIKNGIGLRYHLINRSFDCNGKKSIAYDDIPIRGKTNMMIAGYKLRFRNIDGTNIATPDLHCINSVFGRIF